MPQFEQQEYLEQQLLQMVTPQTSRWSILKKQFLQAVIHSPIFFLLSPCSVKRFSGSISKRSRMVWLSIHYFCPRFTVHPLVLSTQYCPSIIPVHMFLSIHYFYPHVTVHPLFLSRLDTLFFSVQNVPYFSVLFKNATFFSVLFLSFW